VFVSSPAPGAVRNRNQKGTPNTAKQALPGSRQRLLLGKECSKLKFETCPETLSSSSIQRRASQPLLRKLQKQIYSKKKVQKNRKKRFGFTKTNYISTIFMDVFFFFLLFSFIFY
jgi:hypothetical protein